MRKREREEGKESSYLHNERNLDFWFETISLLYLMELLKSLLHNLEEEQEQKKELMSRFEFGSLEREI